MSVKAFERSVARVYNQTKRSGIEIEFSLYEFTIRCKEAFYSANTNEDAHMNAVKNVTFINGKVKHDMMKRCFAYTSPNGLIATMSVTNASQMGSSVARMILRV